MTYINIYSAEAISKQSKVSKLTQGLSNPSDLAEKLNYFWCKKFFNSTRVDIYETNTTSKDTQKKHLMGIINQQVA